MMMTSWEPLLRCSQPQEWQYLVTDKICSLGKKPESTIMSFTRVITKAVQVDAFAQVECVECEGKVSS